MAGAPVSGCGGHCNPSVSSPSRHTLQHCYCVGRYLLSMQRETALQNLLNDSASPSGKPSGSPVVLVHRRWYRLNLYAQTTRPSLTATDLHTGTSGRMTRAYRYSQQQPHLLGITLQCDSSQNVHSINSPSADTCLRTPNLWCSSSSSRLFCARDHILERVAKSCTLPSYREHAYSAITVVFTTTAVFRHSMN